MHSGFQRGLANFLLIVALTLWCCDITEAVTWCPAKCFCQNSIIDCGSRGFTGIPAITPSGSETFTVLRLSNNTIHTIPDGAFQNLHVSRIELDYNQITSISENAFSGVDQDLTSLDMEGNNLNALPNAFIHLTHLTSLNILHNPVRLFTDTVMFTLGTSLTDFTFGDDRSTSWPKQLNHLQALSKLHFEGTAMTTIPFNAFTGFELTLHTLTIRRTGIFTVPIAVKELLYLDEFIFNDNINVGDSGIIDSAFQTALNDNLSPIRTLSLQNNSLTTFPTALQFFTNLENFYMDRNHLWYVTDNMVDNVVGHMYNVSLSSCNLDRIPQAILRIRYLRNLDLSYNNINSIYGNDLATSSSPHEHLATLNLSHNPIAYIAKTSFLYLVLLGEVDLSSTALTEVPKAVGDAPYLTYVHMENTRVECTCELKWITRLGHHAPRIYGDCETITKDINTYIHDRLTNGCPNK